MGRLRFNFETGDLELISKDGFSYDRGELVHNWDNSDYLEEEERRREEEEERRREEEQERIREEEGW